MLLIGCYCLQCCQVYWDEDWKRIQYR